LQAGDLVVSSGQFMLDSEVNLREGLSKLSASAADVASPVDMTMSLPMVITEKSLSAIDLDATSLTQIDHFIDMALYFHAALSKGEAINPSFVDPAIALVDILTVRYRDSELPPILNQSKLALASAKTSLEGQALATDLSRLVLAIKPWILEGAPQHYSDLGLTLYRDLGNAQLWLQKDGDADNPYGANEFEVIPWTQGSRASGLDGSENSQRMKDPHAGHR
jgi:Cu(I)/Ag(I) efflux system membrane fusion protein